MTGPSRSAARSTSAEETSETSACRSDQSAGKRRDSLVPGRGEAGRRRGFAPGEHLEGRRAREREPRVDALRVEAFERSTGGVGAGAADPAAVDRDSERRARPAGRARSEDERGPVRLRRVCDRHEDERLRPAVREGVEDLVEALAESHGPIVRPALVA